MCSRQASGVERSVQFAGNDPYCDGVRCKDKNHCRDHDAFYKGTSLAYRKHSATSPAFLNAEDSIVLIDNRIEIWPDGGGAEENEIFLKKFLNPGFVFDAFSDGDSAGRVGDAGLTFFG